MVKNVTAIVPVKGDSERVRNKNKRSFHDTSLLELKLNQLIKIQGLKEIIVSSEDDECLKIADSMGVSKHKRDPKFSTSFVPMSEVYSYLGSKCNSENILWAQVTNPLVGTGYYQKALEKYDETSGSYDCLLSVSKVKDYIFYKGKPIGFKPNPWPRSQDLKEIFKLTFCINILKTENLIEWGSLVGKKPYFYEINSLESWDIDTQEDFDFCEMIYKHSMS